ncbi:MAG: hypothetical protein EPO68_09145 [Planctomycetota bacterium]|nr:MAG: hypothetical protein EPO68_09145 [Planctomycetota bacterium]
MEAVSLAPRTAIDVRWCATCGERTAHERARRVLPWLRPAHSECVRCAGRVARKSSLLRRWFDGRTIIDPL